MIKFLSGILAISVFLFAHIAGDYFLRFHVRLRLPSEMWAYFMHCFIWAGIISIFLAFYNRFSIGKFIFLFLSHLLIDTSKHNYFPPSFLVNVFDQFLHLVTIFLVFNFGYLSHKGKQGKELS